MLYRSLLMCDETVDIRELLVRFAVYYGHAGVREEDGEIDGDGRRRKQKRKKRRKKRRSKMSKKLVSFRAKMKTRFRSIVLLLLKIH